MRFFFWQKGFYILMATGIAVLVLLAFQAIALFQQFGIYHALSLLILGFFCLFVLILLGLLLLNHQIKINKAIENKIASFEKELQQLTFYDQLTGLPNRRLLFSKLNSLIENAKTSLHSVAIFIISVDNFKMIIDSFGHEISQRLLTEMSDRLKRLVHKNYFVARLDGEEFVNVIDHIQSMLEIANAAQEVLNLTREPIMIDEESLFITVSIGISIFPNNGNDAGTLLKNADIALYHAKELGKNNYQFCTPEMAIQFEERALLDADLHQALVNQEFVLAYQPKISLKTGKIAGIEALIRWNRPQVGIVNPSEFITLAESNGLIVPIGEWMLRTVCLQGKQWHEAGLPVRIAINVSIRQIIISDFITSVKMILAETGFDPHYLEFEITESIFMEYSENNLAVVNALKTLGSKITIDDFGTGYSSLSYLTQFPIDNLKLDKAFIHQINDSVKKRELVSAIIIMAHSLGIHVIAEGVEHPFQLEFLTECGCDEVQGYFYSEPLSVNEISRLFSYNQQ